MDECGAWDVRSWWSMWDVYVFGSGRRGWRGGWMDERIMFGLYQSCWNRGSVGRVSVFWLRWCGWCRWGVGRGLDQGLEGWGGVMYVWGASLDYLCRWQVQVYVYCVWRIPAHLRCTQCSILLHLMDICFLTCIYL